ncbi:DUF502 domain-containing protein [Flavobacterium agrisoli]|uniref:DUF502 domain-containing protein n=1 Tax=Flavobacterium agrisoli TaxID=2793066 RepID=A0A934UKH9_9FLAO|nr:DUF502 domain-containing protein [Flavobacterium agrisoli]MBK0370578.1 DUF502 domain-containing protein [Flavobacterium agrisoli]
MKNITSILKATFIGGILFLVPVILLIVILEKAYAIIHKVTGPIIHSLPKTLIFGIALQEIIAIVIILFICLVAGIIGRTYYAQKFIDKLENRILNLVPGYSFMKNMNENIMGIEAKEDLKVILAQFDDACQMGFLIENINETHCTIFIPNAPSPWSGSLFFMEKERVKELSITQKEAMASIRKLGFETDKLLKDVLK